MLLFIDIIPVNQLSIALDATVYGDLVRVVCTFRERGLA